MSHGGSQASICNREAVKICVAGLPSPLVGLISAARLASSASHLSFWVPTLVGAAPSVAVAFFFLSSKQRIHAPEKQKTLSVVQLPLLPVVALEFASCDSIFNPPTPTLPTPVGMPTSATSAHRCRWSVLSRCTTPCVAAQTTSACWPPCQQPARPCVACWQAAGPPGELLPSSGSRT